MFICMPWQGSRYLDLTADSSCCKGLPLCRYDGDQPAAEPFKLARQQLPKVQTFHVRLRQEDTNK